MLTNLCVFHIREENNWDVIRMRHMIIELYIITSKDISDNMQDQFTDKSSIKVVNDGKCIIS